MQILEKERIKILCKGTTMLKHREKMNQTVAKRKITNPEHVREIDKKSKRKQKAENPDHIKEIAKKSSRRQKVKNPEQVREID